MLFFCFVNLHFLAYLIDPRFCEIKLTDGEKNEVLAWAKENFRANFLSLVMKFLGKTDSFQEFLFEPDMVNQINPHDRWKAHFNKKDVDENK